MYSRNPLLVLVTSLFTGSVLFGLTTSQPVLHPRQSGEGSSSSSGSHKKIWIPLTVVASIFVLGTIFACWGRRYRGRPFRGLRGAAQAAGVLAGTTVPTTREVTAEQLAGVNGGANGGTNRSRRPRRTRRTPSQISTHSLPMYMKEPGDEEIVIVRSSQDMHDDVPITVEMPPLDEHPDETSRGSLDLSAPLSVYLPLPDTTNGDPLLHGSEHSQLHSAAGDHVLNTRASFDSGESSAENSPHHYLDAAPAYDTVVLDDPLPRSASVNQTDRVPSPVQEHQPTNSQIGSGTARRRSVFAAIFNPRHSRLGSASASPAPQVSSPEPRSSGGHTREGSHTSVLSERDPRRSRIMNHRPSHSGSGSMFSLLSRTRSNGTLAGEALTSPSMISLHSISSPLTHTLVKTEFTYPKNGPTPDQLRLISSRESFARFGRPYGADAIAYASTSRVDLMPPPGFEETTGGSSSNGVDSSAVEHEAGRTSPSSESHQYDADASPAHPAAASLSAQSQALEASSERQLLPEVDNTESPVAVTAPDDARTPVALSVSAAEVAVAASSREASFPEPSPSGSPAPPPLSSNTLAVSKAPPSAFKSPLTTTPTDSSFLVRAASRASSYMSYATAEEFLHSATPNESQFDLPGRGDEAYESAVQTPVTMTAPPTPRAEPRHLHETTDTTITPDR